MGERELTEVRLYLSSTTATVERTMEADIANLTSTYNSAQPGWQVIRLIETGKEPTRDDTYTDPIIAFYLNRSGIYPVTINYGLDDEIRFDTVIRPDGKVEILDGETYDDIDVWLECKKEEYHKK